MNKKFTKLTAALALLVGLAIPLGMWGQAPVGTTLWAEDFSGYSANDVPSGEVSSNHTGTDVYNGGSVTYTCVDGGTTTKIWNETNAGGTAPELLVSKKSNSNVSGSFTIAGIPTGDATELTLTYKTNNTNNTVSSPTTGVEVTLSTSKASMTRTWTITTGGASTITLVVSNSASSNTRVDDFSLVVETAGSGGGGGDLQDNDLAVSPTSLALDMHNNPNTGTITCTTSSTGAISVSENDYVTTSVSGNTITVTPVAVTPSAQTITVNQAADDTYAAGSATFTVTVANSTPTVNVTYHANGGVGANIVETPYQGSDYTVAANTFSYTGHSFTKWTTNENGTGDEYQPGATIENISADIDLYAQWQEVNEVVDYLDREFTGVTNGSSSYSTWTNTGTSGVVYKGNSAGGNNAIQLRTTGSASGIVSTTSAGKVTKVEVQWNSSTATGRKINIYGSNTAYTEASQLHNANTAGTLLGTIDYGSTTELTITGDYAYIGIRSQGSALYLDWVKITWATASSDVVATPAINPNGGSFWESQEVSITCATDGATIYYTTDGTDPTNQSTVYSNPFTITATTTVKAFAVKANMTNSEMATAVLTKGTAMTVAQALAATPQDGVYVGGIISGITEVSTQYHNATYTISDDGTNSMTVYRGKYLNNQNFTSEDQIQVGDIVVVYGDLGTYQEAVQLNQDNYLVSLVRPVKAATPTFDPAGGTYYAAQNVTISCETEGATIYYTTDGTTPTTESSVYSEAIPVSTNTTIKAFAVKEGVIDSDIATAEYVIDLTSSINVASNTINVGYAGGNGTLEVTYQNITTVVAEVVLCTSSGEAATYDWFNASINQDNNVSYSVNANDGEARTAYFKVHALDNNANDVYSEIVTVTQAAFVVDYATLPFEWEGGPKEDLVDLTGVSGHGLGSNYAESNAPYRVKFDTDGDYILIKTDQQPGVVTVGIKKLGGANASSITISGSSDGQTFTPIQEFDNDGTTNTELEHTTTVAFNANDRYVRIYFNKPDGGSNVGVGPITIAQVDNTPSITLSTYEVNVDAAEHNGTINVTYKNVEVDEADIYFCDANGNAATYGEWIQVDINNDNNVYYVIGENTGEARTAYFKVYSMDAGTNLVYSNLVTVSQAAPVPTYTVNFNLDGGTFVPTAVFTDDIVEVEAGTYALPSATKTGSSFAGWKLDGTETTYAAGENFEVNADASFTAQWTAVTTYALVESIDDLESGAHYIIAGQQLNNWYAIGLQNGNNRKAVSVTVTDDVIQETSGVYEFVINCISSNLYIIYDNAAASTGYLFAPAVSSNYLRTQAFNTSNGEWTISINETTHVATIKANISDNKYLRYNNGSTVFSCYSSTNSQNDVYLYKKVNDANYEFYKDIKGYGTGSGNWNLIASPVAANVVPTTDNGLLGEQISTEPVKYNFDLYRFNQNAAKEWENYHQHNTVADPFYLVNGQGYLYAKSANVTLHFNGTPATSGQVTLHKEDGVRLSGWNLVGNPYGTTASVNKDFYRMNTDGNEIVQGSGSIAPMEGIFVEAEQDDDIVTFSLPDGNAAPNSNPSVVMNVTQNRSNVIDRAVVRFSDGSNLPKFQLFDHSTKLCIQQGTEEYAVVRSNGQGTMPVNFRANENGEYTLTVNPENVEMNYLHLIDNMTGADVDLLANPSYSFNAKVTDYESRFKLVFASANQNGEEGNDNFAFFSNGRYIIANEGEATLQVIDIMGRILSSETINGSVSKNINAPVGVYMLRLINGNDVKVQKMVVR